MLIPQCLIDELAKFGKKATGNLEWDRAVLAALKNNQEREPWMQLDRLVVKAQEEIKKSKKESENLADPNVYAAHSKFLLFVANEIVLEPQRRKFFVDDNNKKVLRFLLYYFNGSPLCEEVFPERGYKLHKNLLLQGSVGAGKTMLMQVFSEYLRRIGSPRYFHNVSVTQMVNYYSIHNNLDRYTFNEEGNIGHKSQPFNICLNDIGIHDKTFFGMDTGLLTDEFIHARNEIWVESGKCAHLTTNLNNEQLAKRFSKNDGYGRLVDRLKTYNIIPITGSSRR